MDEGCVAGAHEVSILIGTRGAVGQWRGWQPASKVILRVSRGLSQTALGSVARLSLESERKERDAEAYQRENSPDPWQ